MNRQQTHSHNRERSIARPLILAVVAIPLLSGCQAQLPDDGPPPATSQAAARRFVEKAVAAGQAAAESGQFTLVVTQEEVNSFLTIGTEIVDQLQTTPIEGLSQLEGNPELEGIEELATWQQLLEQVERVPNVQLPTGKLRLAIADPRVYFQGNGHITARGHAELLSWRLPIRSVVAPRAAEGELVLDFVEGQVGAVPMPEILFDYVSQGLSEAILLGQEYAQVTHISVGAGTLTVSGRIEQ